MPGLPAQASMTGPETYPLWDILRGTRFFCCDRPLEPEPDFFKKLTKRLVNVFFDSRRVHLISVADTQNNFLAEFAAIIDTAHDQFERIGGWVALLLRLPLWP